MSQLHRSRMFRLANQFVEPLIRWGLPMGVRRAPMALLSVPGRKTGIDRTTPVALAAIEEGWLLVAVFGACDWSRNLETAGRATITQRGHTTEVEARRMPPDEAAPILRDSIADAPAMIRRMTAPYFSADEGSSEEEWERESANHPVFVLSEILDRAEFHS